MKNNINIILVLLIFVLFSLYFIKNYDNFIGNNKLKIAICMWYDENIKNYGDYAKKINKKYCDINNYNLIFSNKRNLPNISPAWERLPLLLNTLNTNKYDYVIWIDADACFNFNSKYKLEKFINDHKDKDIIFSYDMPSNKESSERINSGVMIFKNTLISKKFINSVLNSKDKVCVDGKTLERPWEQNCINHLHKKNIKKKSIILNFNTLQTFPKANGGIFFDKDALIYNYAGVDKKQRYISLKELNEQHVTQKYNYSIDKNINEYYKYFINKIKKK